MTRPLVVSTLIATAVVVAGCVPFYAPAPTAPSPVACSAPPAAISFLGWTTATVPPGSVMLTWDQPSGAVTTCIVELGTTRGVANVGTVVVSGTATSHTFHGLAAGDYFARVRAKNDCGTSAASNEANPRVR